MLTRFIDVSSTAMPAHLLVREITVHLSPQARKIGVDPVRLAACDWSDGLDPHADIVPVLPPAKKERGNEDGARVDGIEAQVGALGRRIGQMETLLQGLVEQSTLVRWSSILAPPACLLPPRPKS